MFYSGTQSAVTTRSKMETALADQGLVRETACAIVDKLKGGEVSTLDLLDVLEKRIDEVDHHVNALPILCFDRARTHAKALMQKKPSERGLLAGLPVPIKDLFDVAGVRNTQGSPIFKDRICERSDIAVETLETRLRLVGRRGRCIGDRHGLARARHRHGRLLPQSRKFLRRRWFAAE